MTRPHQPGQADFRAILSEDIAWLDYEHLGDDPRHAHA